MYNAKTQKEKHERTLSEREREHEKEGTEEKREKMRERIGSTYFIRFSSVTFAFSCDTSFVNSYLKFRLF